MFCLDAAERIEASPELVKLPEVLVACRLEFADFFLDADELLASRIRLFAGIGKARLAFRNRGPGLCQPAAAAEQLHDHLLATRDQLLQLAAERRNPALRLLNIGVHGLGATVVAVGPIAQLLDTPPEARVFALRGIQLSPGRHELFFDRLSTGGHLKPATAVIDTRAGQRGPLRLHRSQFERGFFPPCGEHGVAFAVKGEGLRRGHLALFEVVRLRIAAGNGVAALADLVG